MKMGPSWFVWVLGFSQLLWIPIKMCSRLGQGWVRWDGHRLSCPWGWDYSEEHRGAREVAEVWDDLVPPTAGDALTHPKTLGTVKEPHDRCPGGGGTWRGLTWPTPWLCEVQGEPRTALMMLELGKGQARSPPPAALRLAEARDRAGAAAGAVQRGAGLRGDAGRSAGQGGDAGGRPGPGGLQAVAGPAPSWDVSAVFAKS